MYCPGKVKNVLDSILEMLPEEFNRAEIMQTTTAWSPYALVCLQECERMSLSEICRCLKQLDLSLTTSDFFINSAVALLCILGLSVAFLEMEE